MQPRYDVAVIGGGIVGLATARAVLELSPATSVVVLDKEPLPAQHQTGHNSGVIHSGIYYTPGSRKARFSITGNRSIRRYAEARGVPYEVTGKLIVATRRSELPRLTALHDRGLEHGLEVSLLEPPEAREIEPHVAAVRALHVSTTGIIDFAAVARSFATDVVDLGGELRTSSRVHSVESVGGRMRLVTATGDVESRHVVNCAGLHSDEVARSAGSCPSVRIVAFRGEYFELRPEARHLVRGLVYPVPDPSFPFLGVHLTRGIDSTVHAGPNAVLALSREGYRWRDVDPREVRSLVAHAGVRHLARTHFRRGLAETARSLVRPLFVAELRRMVPAIESRHLVRSPAGVRAQALANNGDLEDDFLIEGSTNSSGAGAMHVLNAPSPAATASLEIGAEIARRILVSSR